MKIVYSAFVFQKGVEINAFLMRPTTRLYQQAGFGDVLVHGSGSEVVSMKLYIVPTEHTNPPCGDQSGLQQNMTTCNAHIIFRKHSSIEHCF